MKKLTLVICLAVGASLPVMAQDAPILTVQSGGDSVDMQLVSQGNNVWGLSSDLTETLANGSKFTLLAADTFLDADPKVQYGLGVTNDDSAADGSFTPYTFTYTTPTTLTAGLYNVSATLAGSLTDGRTNGSTLKPSSVFPYVQQSLIGTADAGVDLLNTAVNEPWANGNSQGFTVAGATGTFNLTTTVSQISIQENFQVSDNDSATLSGRFDVNAVPEPASFGLGLLALGAFAGLVIRARRVRA